MCIPWEVCDSCDCEFNRWDVEGVQTSEGEWFCSDECFDEKYSVKGKK